MTPFLIIAAAQMLRVAVRRRHRKHTARLARYGQSPIIYLPASNRGSTIRALLLGERWR